MSRQRKVHELPFDVVDVFVDDGAGQPFSGNPLAVVHGAGELSDADLLAVAGEFGYSETTFPEPLGDGAYRVRIFTPGAEIPFAGHPTLGTAWVLRDSGVLDGPDAVQHCGAGEVGVRFVDDDGLIELSATPRTLQGPLPPRDTAGLADAVGLTDADVVGPAWVAGAGLDFAYLPVSPDAVGRARAAQPYEDYEDYEGIDVYAVGSGDPLPAHCRVFVPGLAVPEDPATGSAAAGLGLVLAASGVLPGGGDVEIRQGVEIGRPSRILLSVAADDGRATSLRVAGRVVRSARGTIDVPA